MSHTPRGRWGTLGGLGGGIVGALTWVVVAGVWLRDPRVWVSALAVAATCWWAGAWLFRRAPGRWVGILGLVLLVLVLVDGLYLALLLPRLPAERVNPYWDISRTALRPLVPLLSAGGAVATLLILFDVRRKRKGESHGDAARSR